MPSAEIITIGTEILLGEIVDTNARYLARALRDVGIDLYRKTTVGDNAQRIAQAIQEALQRNEIIITTGGLGPTIDDPTRDAVAQSIGVQTEYHPELWDQIQARFRRFNRVPTENNKRQAFIPAGALAIENPVGTAPAFICEHGMKAIIALPGVPREMEHLFMKAVLPYLRQRYDLQGMIKARIIHTAGAGESQIDLLIGDLEELSNPTVGLAAHSGQVDVRITAKASSEVEADVLIAPIEEIVRERLKDWVYGADEESLEEIVLNHIGLKGWSITVVEAGLNGNLSRKLSTVQGAFLGGEVLTKVPTPDELEEITSNFRNARGAQVGIGVAIYPEAERQDVRVVIITPEGKDTYSRPYGGPPENAPRWALHQGLDLLRKL